jgi:hypothetical protein
MLQSVKHLTGYLVKATDGDIGTVNQFFFSSETWIIRYIVIDIGKWLSGRKVLVAPGMVVYPPDWNKRAISINLTKQQIEESPQIDDRKPVSRQKEIELHKYFNWVPYWLPGPGEYINPPISAIEYFANKKEVAEQDNEKEDPQLRSTKEVLGYRIHARDGEIGHAEDFIMDDRDWIIRYLVVDTRNWLPGKKVLVSPEWIENVSWADSEVQVDLSQEAVKESPPYDPAAPVNREYEVRVYDYYGRPVYWESHS